MLFQKEKIKRISHNIINKKLPKSYYKNNILSINKNQSILNDSFLLKIKKHYMNKNYIHYDKIYNNEYRLAHMIVNGIIQL